MSDTIRLRPYRDYRAPLPLGQRWEDYWRQCWERAGLQLKTIMEKKNEAARDVHN